MEMRVERIRTIMLDCGMPLLVETMAGVRSAALSWLLPAGTATEPADRLGLSTLWAELLMRGAGDLGSREHADALDRLGIGRATDTGSVHLRVGASMLGERLMEGLPLLVDMVRRPRFDAAALDPARDLALQAIESLKDDPTERAMIAARARHFPAPLDRSSLGTVAGLGAVTRDDVVARWAERARPVGSILGVAGAVDAERLAERLNTLLEGWSGAAAPYVRGLGAPRGYAHEMDETNQVQIVTLSDAPPEPDPSSMPEKVVVSVLSGGMSGRLFTEVREKRGLCYSVSAGYSPGKEFGSIVGYVGTTPERAQTSLDVLLAEMERINTPAGAIEQNEFDRAIIGMKSRLVFSGESTSARASALVHDYYRLGRARGLDEVASEVDAMTPQKVNQHLARRRTGTPTIQTLGPAPLVPPA
jgi:predicted Zn-dependent peptidase